MKLTFAGVGGAFAPKEQYQTNAFFTNDRGKHLLIDCGSDARFSLAEAGVNLMDIHSVYITHLHSDHVGGLEWLGFLRFFTPKKLPLLFAADGLIHELWYSTLRGGMESLQGKVATLNTYFNVNPVHPNGEFVWNRVVFKPVQTVHVVSGYKINYSYGLMIDLRAVVEEDAPVKKIFYTGDTQFAPNQLMDFYKEADLIFHDCETSVGFKSGVHAHFDDLKELLVEIKKKMWLMHYSAGTSMENLAKKHGFAGFVEKGQVFEF